ncbi:MAG: TadE/TadG family type IV pilus assembly protein [Pseudomonadota bacterium]
MTKRFPSQPQHKGKRRGILRRFRRDNSGVTALEFAIVGPIFMSMMFFSMESGIFFFKQNWLKHILYETSRYIQTGQLERAGNTEEALRDFICSISDPYVNCHMIDVDVKRFAQYSDVAFPDPVFDVAGRAQNFAFDLSGTGDIVATRISMPHEFTTKLMHDAMLGEELNSIVLNFSVARNEPKLLTSP